MQRDRKHRKPLALILVMLATVVLSDAKTEHGLLQAATFTVDFLADGTHDANPGDGVAEDQFGNTTFRVAVEEANALSGADTIQFSTSLVGNGNSVLVSMTDGSTSYGSELVITGDLTINGLGWNLPLNQSANLNNSRVFEVSANATVAINSLVVIYNISGGDGGVILNHGNLTLSNSELDNNQNGGGGAGGAVGNDHGSLTIDSCTFDSNLSSGDGGAIWNVGPCEITASVFSHNNAPNNGGAISSWNDPTTDVNIHDCGFDHNGSTGYGGAIYNNAQMTIDQSSDIDYNGGSNVGGGGIFNDVYAELTLDSVTIQFNSTPPGGNVAPNDGGGIMAYGTLVVHANCVISDNDPDDIIYGN